jgi:hypothetical protein
MSEKQNQREQMFALIEQWKQSGMSQQAYCKAHSFSYVKFGYWYKRYKVANGLAEEKQSGFIKIEAPQISGTEIIYPDGKRLLFHQGVSVHFLKALL